MARVLPKHNVVMKAHVQSTEDSVTGTNGLHAPWNASAIFQNANVVTWIHVHLNAQHNHFKS